MTGQLTSVQGSAVHLYIGCWMLCRIESASY